MSGALSTSPSSVAGEVGVELYRRMLLARRMAEKTRELWTQKQVHGPGHLSDGHEAISVGVAAALREGDATIGTYRGHAHALARGADPEAVLRELLGREGGVCRGKGGSMHITSVEHGYFGSYAIVGAHLPIACGLAWAQQLRGDGHVTACFFGDGATNIGAFHEAVNLAAVWKLPLLFVCENNHYMEYTPISAVTSVTNPAADRAVAYGLPSEVIDGNDVLVVKDAVARAAWRAREGEGPTVIEAHTYRQYGHSRADPAKYRPAGEVEEWLKRDPLNIARTRLETLDMSAEDIAAADARAGQIVDAAIDAAKNAPDPDPAQAFTDVWADGGAAWRT
jgi:acetoin:2,6-dichlorophenolindophenol oxidoreductase subunit alpha